MRICNPTMVWYSRNRRISPGKTAKPKVAALRLKADSEFLSIAIMNEEFTDFEIGAPNLRRPCRNMNFQSWKGRYVTY